MIEVCADDHIFPSQCGIAAGDQCDDVLRRQSLGMARMRHLHASRLESLEERLAAVGRGWDPAVRSCSVHLDRSQAKRRMTTHDEGGRAIIARSASAAPLQSVVCQVRDVVVDRARVGHWGGSRLIGAGVAAGQQEDRCEHETAVMAWYGHESGHMRVGGNAES